MGIKGFQSFLSKNCDKALPLEEVKDQYLMIDGSEIMYELFCDSNPFSRANYVEFREKVKTFFKNLQACNIKPIVIKDGFKFEYDNEIYARRRLEKIQNLIPISRKQENNYSFKGYFCEYVFKQTAKELGVPYFVARHNSDEDLAALSQLLNAPVLATDTMFCAYYLQAGCIPLKFFDWKNISQGKNGKFIKARLYQIDRFAEAFSVQQWMVSIMGIVFDNKDYDKYQSLREDISSQMRRHFDRPYNIQTFIDWCKMQRYSRDKFIDEMMMQYLRDDISPESERESINQKMSDFNNPRLKPDLLQGLIPALDDPYCQRLLIAAQNDVKEEEEEKQPTQRPELRKTLEGDFPYWALQLLIYHDRQNELVHFLPLVISDPEEFPVSPQEAGAFIREWSYRILFRDAEETSIKVYDRRDLDYTSETVLFDSYEDNNNLFSNRHDEANQLIRQDFILDLLIADRTEAERYKQQINNLPDDMKLTMAATICWIHKTYPSSEMQKAMAVLFTLMLIKERSKSMQLKVMAVFVTIKRIIKEFKAEANTQVLQWTSQWEVILDEAINLNQILMSPLPNPILGKFFSASLLDDLHGMISRNEEKLKIMLKKLEEYESQHAIVASTMLLE